MNKTNPFTIYDAAAGSGKTFTLVKEYLKIILLSKNEGYYKHLLAITFTNKAVAEMKQRIINNLVLFSNSDAIENSSEMAIQIVDETNLSLNQIQIQSKKILKHLLHNYSGLSVETIDHFNHRLIRTFARDLKLSGNFEVSLDTLKLVTEAVDQLIGKTGEESKNTKILLDFALKKTDDDMSWDISKDIVKMAGLLFNENDALHVSKLKEKKLKDFLNFRKQLNSKRDSLIENIFTRSQDVINKITSEGIQPEDFNRKTLFNHFLKLSEGDYKVYKNKLLQSLEEGGNALYKKNTSVEIASKIDVLTPFFLKQYVAIKRIVFKLHLCNSMLKNITPLSIINLVNQEIESIKEKQNILPISEFNHLINTEIKDQPIPFIYERMGERYRHFFIDEFQDTSLLQWENLIPLIDNALSQQYQNGKKGSLLLVGDAKQSIYRWRGGLPEQFISLCQGNNPFSVKENIQLLETNFRSYNEIVTFNNSFFSFISKYFGNPKHTDIYTKGNKQKTNKKDGGYVQFKFIETLNKEEAGEQYAKEVYQTIIDLKEKGFVEHEICILTRKKKDGIFLGAFLLQQGISIISSETLLLQYSSMVQVLVDAITLSLYPENEETKINLLNFLHHHFSIEEEKHTFFTKFLHLSDIEFSEILNVYGVDFDLTYMQSVPLYQSCEYCIRNFKLDLIADAYLYGFLDFVFEFEQQPKASKILFLEEWNTEKEKLSIPISEGNKGVQIMTIHKAKGLEFPVVLFPFADLKLYYEKDAKTWFPINLETCEFEETLINFNNDVAEYGTVGEEIYKKRRNTLELDNFNLLYVTLTRAIEQLYVFAEKPKEITSDLPSNYNDLFGAFLEDIELWDESKDTYEFGSSIKLSSEDIAIEKMSFTPHFISTSPLAHNINVVTREASLWETEAEKAISTGTLLHDTMAKIKYKQDISFVFDEIINRAVIPHKAIQKLREDVSAIVTHSELEHFFEVSEKIINERDIITSTGTVLRPDRLNIHKDKSITIIDYKTGTPNKIHHAQINGYALALKEMGYQISEKILIYISDNDFVINKV